LCCDKSALSIVSRPPTPNLAAVIDRHTNDSIKKIGRTKAQVLKAIKAYDIANKRCLEVTSVDVIAFASQLMANPVHQHRIISGLELAAAALDPVRHFIEKGA
jgi:hypothetical protein